MPEQVSLPALQGMLAQETDVVYLVKLKFEHPNITTLRLVNDKVDHTDGAGNTWKAFPFDAVLPDDDEEAPPTADLVCSNVSRDILLKIRELNTRPTVTMEVVTDQGFDTQEYGPVTMDLRGYDADAQQIRLRVGPAVDYLNAAFPFKRFLPSNAGQL